LYFWQSSLGKLYQPIIFKHIADDCFMLIIEQAQPSQAADIARLIMEAMNHDCCLYFAGETHGLMGFHQLMTHLVGRTDSQYSYLNTLVALDAAGKVIGICTSYDGAELRRLRTAFVQSCLEQFGRDFSDMDDETAAGELYVDSLAVDAHHRGQGIAKALLDRGYAVLYFSSAELFDQVAKVKLRREPEDGGDIEDIVDTCDLLVIDDLGTELVNNFVNSELFHIINNRLLAGKGTIISTNLDLKAMRDNYTERITSRIINQYTTIPLYGEDIRGKK